MNILLSVLIFHMINERNSTKCKALQIINEVITYTNQKHLSIYIKKRILAHYKYRFQSNYFRQSDIFSKFTGKQTIKKIKDIIYL